MDIRLNHSESGIAPRPSDDISRDTVYEYDMSAQGRGERKIDVNWSPRWDGLEIPDSDHINTPWDHHDPEGIEAEVQGFEKHDCRSLQTNRTADRQHRSCSSPKLQRSSVR